MDKFEFHNPWILLLAIPALVLLYWRYRHRRESTAAIMFPSVARFAGLRPTLRQRARVMIPLLQALALVSIVIALARPREGDARTVIKSQGIAVQMVLDRSSSMEETMRYQGFERSRIDIVKDVFQQFVQGGGGLDGRETDLIGLTTFSRFTEESCPLVSQHEPLLNAVNNLSTVEPALDQYKQPIRDVREAQRRGVRLVNNPLNATAIGDGLYRAVLSLVSAEDDLRAEETVGEDELTLTDSSGYEITGKVIVLLTDGQNNAGRDPVEAGRYAAENDIRVYYVMFHETVQYERTIFGRTVERELSEDDLLDEPRRVVTPSGGRAFLARDGDELKEIYEEIDALEKSEVGRIEFRSYNELYRYFLIPGFGFALVAMLLAETFLRRIP